MPSIPTKRLFVYIATGLVVLVAGTVGLVCTRSGASAANGVVIETGAGTGGLGGATFGDVSAAVDVVGATAASSTSTSTTQLRKIWVQVAGAVLRPGVYQVPAGSRVFQAVLEAGGFANDADQQATALAAELSDGCRIYVPKVGEAVAGAVQSPAQSSAGVSGGASGASPGGSPGGPLSLNTATLDQLDALPGVGPALAQQIITYRETQGPFTSVDQLDDVPGIGPAKLEQLRPLVGL